MPGYTSGIPFLYNDFHGGLNTKDAYDLLTDNEARDLANVQGTTAGAVVKRNGLVTFAQPSAVLGSLAPAEATPAPYLVGASGSQLVSISPSGTVTNIGSSSVSRWEFVNAPIVGGQGPLYGMNGGDTPQQWSGSGMTSAWTATDSGGVVPNGRFCLYANNQVFVAGVSTHPSRLYWSGLGDPTAWNPANLNGSGFEDFDPADGQPITGIGRVGPYVLVCKARKLFILIDTATASSRRLADNVGCVAHRSIASAPEGTYFLTEDRGVYLTNGSKLTPISDKIQPTIDLAVSTQRQFAAGTYFAGHYYLSLTIGQTTGTADDTLFGDPATNFAGTGSYAEGSNASANNTTLDYDAVLGSWWKHSFGSNQFAIWHPTTAAGLYSAKGTGAVVDQCFVPGATVDNGVPFTWRWAGPWQSPTFYRRRRFPTPYFRKRLRQLRYDGSGTIDLYLAKDFAPIETLLRTDILSQANSASASTFNGSGAFGVDGVFGDQLLLSRGRINNLGVANAFSLVFGATSTTEDVLTSYTMMVADRKDSVVA